MPSAKIDETQSNETREKEKTKTNFHVKMEDVLEVDELDALADLPHEVGTRSLRQHKVVVDHAFKEFAPFDA